MKKNTTDVTHLLSSFTGQNLTATLGSIEGTILGITAGDCSAFLQKAGAAADVLAAAAEMKRLAGQINATIHALGILLCLPHILEPGERVEYVSLGAGNTGRLFDLETNFRVAEFKFIHWKGGAESIRQNGIFKDFFLLADQSTTKRKFLYLLGTQHALKFLQGGRLLDSVLGRSGKLHDRFRERHGEQFARVRDYYAACAHLVSIEDVSLWLSELAANTVDSAQDDSSSRKRT